MGCSDMWPSFYDSDEYRRRLARDLGDQLSVVVNNIAAACIEEMRVRLAVERMDWTKRASLTARAKAGDK